MNEPVVVAWVGVGLSALVQGAGIAFFLGRLSSKHDGLAKRVDEHAKELETHEVKSMPTAHGCPYFQPERHDRT